MVLRNVDVVSNALAWFGLKTNRLIYYKNDDLDDPACSSLDIANDANCLYQGRTCRIIELLKDWFAQIGLRLDFKLEFV